MGVFSPDGVTQLKAAGVKINQATIDSVPLEHVLAFAWGDARGPVAHRLRSAVTEVQVSEPRYELIAPRELSSVGLVEASRATKRTFLFVIVVGDTAHDFAYAHALDRILGRSCARVIWAPLSALGSLIDANQIASVMARAAS